MISKILKRRKLISSFATADSLPSLHYPFKLMEIPYNQSQKHEDYLKVLSSRSFSFKELWKSKQESTSNEVLYEDNDVEVVIVKSPDLVEEIALLCAKAFVKGDPVITAAGMGYEDLFKQAKISGEIGAEEGTLFATLCKKTGRLICTRMFLSYNGKKRYQERFEKEQLIGNLEIHDDILNMVEITDEDLSKGIYCIMLATNSAFAGKGYASKLVNITKEYLKTTPYEFQYADTTSYKSLSVIQKAGGIIKKQFYYKEYEFKGIKFFPPDFNEVLSAYIMPLKDRNL